jgi:hypothetical protein
MASYFSYLSWFSVFLLMVALMSGILSLIREWALIHSPDKINEKRLFWGCVRIAFVASAITVWGIEHHDVIALHEQIDALTKPDFELSRGSFVISNMVETHGDVTRKHAIVFVPLSILNHGAPSVIAGWTMKATLTDGTQVTGDPFGIHQPLIFPRKDGPITFSTDQSLFKKGTSSPIPTGGMVEGFVLFIFPDETKDRLQSKGTVITLTLEDSIHHPYTLEIKPTGINDADAYMAVPPSLQ